MQIFLDSANVTDIREAMSWAGHLRCLALAWATPPAGGVLGSPARLALAPGRAVGGDSQRDGLIG